MQNKKNNWLNFYSSVDINKEIESQAAIHEVFIKAIINSSEDRILEVGSGMGAVAFSILKNKKYTIVTIDNNLEILKKVQSAARELGLNIILVCADALNLPFKEKSFNVAFSQGLFEHFSDEQIKTMIREELKAVSGHVLFSVPNNYYKHKDFGNERLMPKEEWEKILSSFHIAESVNYYYLRTKRNLLRRLPVMYMCRIKK